MKRRCIVLGATAVLMVAVLVVFAAPASAAPVKTDFTSTWFLTGFSYDLSPHDSGQGNVVHFDDFHITQLVFSSDPTVSGSVVLDGDSRLLMKDGVRLQAEWTGKFTLTSGQGEVWTGGFTLKNDVTGASFAQGQAIGTAGAVTGWVMKFNGYAGYLEPMTVTGYYMEK